MIAFGIHYDLLVHRATGRRQNDVAMALIKELKLRGRPAVHWDGDILRAVTDNKDFSTAGRMKNVKAAQALAVKIPGDDIWVVAAFVSPFRQLREEFKKRGDVVEICVHTTAMRGRENYFVKDCAPPLENFVDADTTNSSIEDRLKKILPA